MNQQPERTLGQETYESKVNEIAEWYSEYGNQLDQLEGDDPRAFKEAVGLKSIHDGDDDGQGEPEQDLMQAKDDPQDSPLQMPDQSNEDPNLGIESDDEIGAMIYANLMKQRQKQQGGIGEGLAARQDTSDSNSSTLLESLGEEHETTVDLNRPRKKVKTSQTSKLIKNPTADSEEEDDRDRKPRANKETTKREGGQDEMNNRGRLGRGSSIVRTRYVPRAGRGSFRSFQPDGRRVNPPTARQPIA